MTIAIKKNGPIIIVFQLNNRKKNNKLKDI
jgi:hypothetical protein